MASLAVVAWCLISVVGVFLSPVLVELAREALGSDELKLVAPLYLLFSAFVPRPPAVADLEQPSLISLTDERILPLPEALEAFDALSRTRSGESVEGEVAAKAEDLTRRLSAFLAPLRPGARLAASGAKPKHPVVLLHGVAGSELELWQGLPCARRHFREQLWGEALMLAKLLLSPSCWLQHIMMDEDTGLDPIGIRLRTSSGLSATEFAGTAYSTLGAIVQSLADVGYDETLLGVAAYDWRLSADLLELRDRYLTRLKLDIERLVDVSGQKAVLVTHSMGGLITNYFLQWVHSDQAANVGARCPHAELASSRHHASDSDDGEPPADLWVNPPACDGWWADKYLHTWMEVGSPLLGTPKSVSTLLSGEMAGTSDLGPVFSKVREQLLNRRAMRSMYRSMRSTWSMLPMGGERIWGSGLPLQVAQDGSLAWRPGVDALDQTAELPNLGRLIVAHHNDPVKAAAARRDTLLRSWGVVAPGRSAGAGSGDEKMRVVLDDPRDFDRQLERLRAEMALHSGAVARRLALLRESAAEWTSQRVSEVSQAMDELWDSLFAPTAATGEVGADGGVVSAPTDAAATAERTDGISQFAEQVRRQLARHLPFTSLGEAEIAKDASSSLLSRPSRVGDAGGPLQWLQSLLPSQTAAAQAEAVAPAAELEVMEPRSILHRALAPLPEEEEEEEGAAAPATLPSPTDMYLDSPQENSFLDLSLPWRRLAPASKHWRRQHHRSLQERARNAAVAAAKARAGMDATSLGEHSKDAPLVPASQASYFSVIDQLRLLLVQEDSEHEAKGLPANGAPTRSKQLAAFAEPLAWRPPTPHELAHLPAADDDDYTAFSAQARRAERTLAIRHLPTRADLASPAFRVAAGHLPRRFWSNPLAVPLPHAPKMNVYCLVGTGIATERAHHYDSVLTAPNTPWHDLPEVQAIRERQAADVVVAEAAGYRNQLFGQAEESAAAAAAAAAGSPGEPTRSAGKEMATAAAVELPAVLTSSLTNARRSVASGAQVVDGDGAVTATSASVMCLHAWHTPERNPANMSVTLREYRATASAEEAGGAAEQQVAAVVKAARALVDRGLLRGALDLMRLSGDEAPAAHIEMLMNEELVGDIVTVATGGRLEPRHSAALQQIGERAARALIEEPVG